jgi:hypothetical protein
MISTHNEKPVFDNGYQKEKIEKGDFGLRRLFRKELFHSQNPKSGHRKAGTQEVLPPLCQPHPASRDPVVSALSGKTSLKASFCPSLKIQVLRKSAS